MKENYKLLQICTCIYVYVFVHVYVGVADYAESVRLIKIYFQDVVIQLYDIFYEQLNLSYFFYEQDRSWACLCGTSTISTDSVCSSGRQTPHRYSKHRLVQIFYQPIGRSDFDNFNLQIYVMYLIPLYYISVQPRFGT